MGIYQICFLCLVGTALNGFAQGQDAVREKRVKFAIYPAVRYTPETKVNLGAIAFFVFNMACDATGQVRPC